MPDSTRPPPPTPMCVDGAKGPQWTRPTITGGSEDVMAGTEPKIYDVSEYKPAPGDKHVHHGRTAAAWAGSTIALIGFLVWLSAWCSATGRCSGSAACCW